MTDGTEGTGSVTPESFMKALEQHGGVAQDYYDKILKQIKKLGDSKMTDVITMPQTDGVLGSNGMIGGLILGSLLRNNGNLFGNNGTVDAQPQANMSIMSALGDLKQAVAVGTAQMETSQALQSSTIQAQLSQVAQATVAQVNGLKDVVNANTVTLMGQNNELQKTIMQGNAALAQTVTSDGDKTRALLISQYEATLNRQLSDANAQIVELRSEQRLANATRGIEVNTTNNINQAQAQQQQQQQYLNLANLVNALANDLQYIRSTNQAINIGAGTQTANPINTNNNVRA